MHALHILSRIRVINFVGLFLNGRRQHQERQRVTLPKIVKVWPQVKQLEDYEGINPPSLFCEFNPSS